MDRVVCNRSFQSLIIQTWDESADKGALPDPVPALKPGDAVLHDEGTPPMTQYENIARSKVSSGNLSTAASFVDGFLITSLVLLGTKKYKQRRLTGAVHHHWVPLE